MLKLFYELKDVYFDFAIKIDFVQSQGLLFYIL